MTKQENRRGGVSKLARTETVTVRLDSKLRYLAELAARVQRRTVSSFIEWAIQASLAQVKFSDTKDGTRSVADESENLWDVDEADRFVKLAFHHPNLMTYEEQVLWKTIQKTSYLWNERINNEGDFDWKVEETNLDKNLLRNDWGYFVAITKGEDVSNWFLLQRGRFESIGGSIYASPDGIVYVDADGSVRIDDAGNIHINQDAIVMDNGAGGKVVKKRRYPKVMDLSIASCQVSEDGYVYRDKEGDLLVDRSSHRVAADLEKMEKVNKTKKKE
jgi:hypothetical protein